MKLISKIKIPIAALAMLLVGATVCSTVFAEEGGGASITVTPSDRRVSLQAGESYRTTVKVTNGANSSENLRYKVYANPYSVKDEQYNNVDYDDKGVHNQIVDWIEFDQNSGEVAPNETDEISFTIKVPTDAEAGGQYAAIVIEKVIDDTDAQGNTLNVKSVHRVAMPLYANVAGDTTESGSIVENKINTFFTGAPIFATALVENTGNVHADATFILKVYPLFSNEEIYSNEEKDQLVKIVLPDTRRFVTNSWDGSDGQPAVPWLGIFRAESTVKFMGEELTASKIIIVCPLWLIFIIIFLIVFVVVWLITRNKKRKASNHNKGTTSDKSNKSDGSSPAPSAE